MGILAYGLIAIAVMGMLGTGVYKVKQWGGNEVRAEWNEANEAARKKEAEQSAKAAKELADERAKKKVVYRTITQSVDKYIDRPIYRAECFDADGLRDARDAINGKVADRPKPDTPMPAPKPAG